MKKILSLLAVAVIFFNCSKDTDDTDNELQNFTVTLNVDSNHRFSRFQESTFAFLSDENGTILATGELRIGETTTLSFSGSASNHYDLSYMRYDNIVDLGIKTYSLVTFTNIEQGTYDIGPTPIIENSHDEIFINMDYTGYPFEVTSGVTGAGGGGPENGGYYNFRSNLSGSPTSDFYASFKSPNDQFERYFWQTDISEGSVFNIDYNTLPEIQNIISVQSPTNTIFGFAVEGIIEGDINKVRHSIKESNLPNGYSSISIPLPDNIFDNYLFTLSYGNGAIKYFKTIRTADIPSTIDTPELSFVINNTSPQAFNMSTTGNSGIYNIIFRDTNSSETIFVAHSIYGEITPEISFSKESLRKNIQETYSDLKDFETLPLGSVSLTHYNSLNSYKDILQYRIEGEYYEIPKNSFIEGISKQFD